jgi:hypothetical protein
MRQKQRCRNLEMIGEPANVALAKLPAPMLKVLPFRFANQAAPFLPAPERFTSSAANTKGTTTS